jgi:thiamine biosynthesis protein ThiS
MSKGAMITVNGIEQSLGPHSIAELLAERGIAVEARGIAVARNGAVVLRRLWPTTALAAGDSIEIIKAVSGG